MEIYRKQDRSSRAAPDKWFTGQVSMEDLSATTPPARAEAKNVTFQAGARTHWHTHPLGQTLIVTHGRGRVQTDGEPVVEMQAGDVVWIPPHEKHWHGAAADAAMTHIAIHEALDGSTVTWLEPVSDQDYLGGDTGA